MHINSLVRTAEKNQAMILAMLSLAGLIALVMAVGDTLLQFGRPDWAPQHIWALVDAPIHGVLGVLVVWPLAARSAESKTGWMMLAAAGLVSILIDLDHFIFAGSLSLYLATHLDGRPITHSLVFALICALLTLKFSRNPMTGTVVLLALVAHFLRDAVGGGIPFFLWPVPFGRLPLALYYLALPSLSVAAWAFAQFGLAPVRNEHRPAQTPAEPSLASAD